jgi:hypothetical protein
MTVNPVSSNSLATTALDIRPATQPNEVKSPAPEKKAEGAENLESIAPKAPDPKSWTVLSEQIRPDCH